MQFPTCFLHLFFSVVGADLWRVQRTLIGQILKYHPDNLPDPDFIARENIDDLEAALEKVRGMTHY